eukprot:g2654.t2
MSVPKGHWFHYVSVAGNLHPLESLVVYALGLGIWMAPPELKTLFYTNCWVQAALFLPFVQLPVALTGHMAYVDIAWPSGLVAIALVAFLNGSGFWPRRWLMSACYLLHGGRMALGALVMFGQSTNFTYRFAEDLPRYRYAKHKWSQIDGMPESHWWLKMQQETLGQGFSNSVLLCVPAFLTVSNPAEGLHLLEWMGLGIWLGGWMFESAADLQKISFMEEQQRLRREDTLVVEACQAPAAPEALLGRARLVRNVPGAPRIGGGTAREAGRSRRVWFAALVACFMGATDGLSLGGLLFPSSPTYPNHDYQALGMSIGLLTTLVANAGSLMGSEIKFGVAGASIPTDLLIPSILLAEAGVFFLWMLLGCECVNEIEPISLSLSLRLVSGTGLEAARGQGLLFPVQMPQHPVFYRIWTQHWQSEPVDWQEFLSPTFWLTVVNAACISALTAVMNIFGTASSTQIRVDIDQEMMLHGIYNMGSGLLSGLSANMVMSFSITCRTLGADGQQFQILLFIFSCLVFVSGDYVVAVLPKLLPGSVLVWLSLELMAFWVWDSLRFLRAYEYCLVWVMILMYVILGTAPMMLFGFISVAGIVQAQLATIPVLGSRQTLGKLRSPRLHTTCDREYLNRVGSQAEVWRLRTAYLYFASMRQIVQALEHFSQQPFEKARITETTGSWCAGPFSTMRRTLAHSSPQMPARSPERLRPCRTPNPTADSGGAVGAANAEAERAPHSTTRTRVVKAAECRVPFVWSLEGGVDPESPQRDRVDLSNGANPAQTEEGGEDGSSMATWSWSPRFFHCSRLYRQQPGRAAAPSSWDETKALKVAKSSTEAVDEMDSAGPLFGNNREEQLKRVGMTPRFH